MNNHPRLLSVCLITYNQNNYIKQAIESILMQKGNFSWELIIADDFSTDGTREIILEYYSHHPNLIKLILQDKNVGASKNWLDLVSSAQSKYIALCEGDDYWTDPLKLQKQVDFLEQNSNYSMCCHAAKLVYEDSTREPELARSAEADTTFNIDYFFQPMSKNIFRTESVVFRADYIQELPKWFKQIVVGDYPLFLWLAHHGEIRYINQVMSVYRKHSGGMWTSNYKKPEYIEKYYLSTVEMYRNFDEYTNFVYHSKINKRIPYRYYQMVRQLAGHRTLYKKFFYKYFWKLPVSKRWEIFQIIYFVSIKKAFIDLLKIPYKLFRKVLS